MRSETRLLEYIDAMAPPVTTEEAIARRQAPTRSWVRVAIAAVAVLVLLGGLVWLRSLDPSVPPATVPEQQLGSNGFIAYSYADQSTAEGYVPYLADPIAITAQPLFSTQPAFGGDTEGLKCPVFSPDGTLLAYSTLALSTERSLDVVALPSDGSAVDGSVAPVHSVPLGRCGTFSPDGTSIATVVEDSSTLDEADPGGAMGDVGVFSLDTGTTELLGLRVGVGYGGYSNYPRTSWVPDGGELLVSENGNLWRVPLDGSEAILLGDGEPIDSASFSPDGTAIAFAGYDGSFEAAQQSDIWTAQWPFLDGRRQITATPQWEYGAVWSPDGDNIAFVRAEQFIPGPGGVVVIADQEGEARVLESPVVEFVAAEIETFLGVIDTNSVDEQQWQISDLTWSPDGKRLAYTVRADVPVETEDAAQSMLPLMGLVIVTVDTGETLTLVPAGDYYFADGISWQKVPQ